MKSNSQRGRRAVARPPLETTQSDQDQPEDSSIAQQPIKDLPSPFVPMEPATSLRETAQLAAANRSRPATPAGADDHVSGIKRWQARPQNILKNTTEDGLSPIKEFFANANIFITGGTGFMGILLLEKLLVACPNICTIYILIRNKKGKNVQARLDQLFDDPIFSRLKQTYPNFREKLVPIEGDCELENLGISTQDMALLIKEVNIVFHGAATIRFDAPLKKAAFINVRAVRDIVRMACQMQNLKSFVHISTAYSNCVHSHIKEEIYPASVDYKKLLNLAENLSDDLLSMETPMLLGKFPNTYSFTKQIGEDVVKHEGAGLPIGIHRPSIVVSTLKEPIRGWVNNISGPGGLGAAYGLGILRAAFLNEKVNTNLVPADLVVNSIIAATWDIAENFSKEPGNIPVYNFEGSQAPSISWSYFVDTALRYTKIYSSSRAVWHIYYISCDNKVSFFFVKLILHTIPAVIGDTVLVCIGKPPMWRKVYRKMDSLFNMLHFFMVQEWSFDSENVSRLKSRMSEEDQQTFFCEMKNLNWLEYMDYYVQGVRVHLVKDPMETLPQAQKKARRLYFLHVFISHIVTFLVLWLLWTFFSMLF